MTERVCNGDAGLETSASQSDIYQNLDQYLGPNDNQLLGPLMCMVPQRYANLRSRRALFSPSLRSRVHSGVQSITKPLTHSRKHPPIPTHPRTEHPPSCPSAYPPAHVRARTHTTFDSLLRILWRAAARSARLVSNGIKGSQRHHRHRVGRQADSAFPVDGHEPGRWWYCLQPSDPRSPRGAIR